MARRARPAPSTMTRRVVAPWSVGLLLLAGLAGGGARAQQAQDTLPVERFRVPIDNTGFGTTEGGGIADHLEFQVGVVGNYTLSPLVFQTRDPINEGLIREAAVLQHRFAGAFVGTVGLFDYGSLGVELPVTFFQMPGPDIDPTYAEVLGLHNGIASFGTGDLKLVPKIRILREDRHFVSLALLPAVSLPTALGFKVAPQYPGTTPDAGANPLGPVDYGGSYLGEGAFAPAFLPEVALSTNFFGLRVAGNLGWRLRPSRLYLGAIPTGPDLTGRAGIGYDIAWVLRKVEPELKMKIPVPSLLVYAEVFGATGDRDPFGLVTLLFPGELSDTQLAVRRQSLELTNHLEYSAGVRWEIWRGIHTEAGFSSGLVNGFGAPDIRLYGGVRYAFEQRDKDGDGIQDENDACPDVAEDKDGFEDSDGCVDADNDGDGLPDLLDRCPDEAEDQDGYLDADGCVDPDNDEDGIKDLEDRCPDEAGPVQTGGCPLSDRDLDGLPDEIDRCPDEPGPAERDGCPVRDQDGDGIPDESDKCPAEKGPPERQGCPPKDRDLDGVEDGEDECPDSPGPVERRGCPLGDRDLDGVLDNVDKCPDEKGPASRKGCPIPDTDGDGIEDDKDECVEVPGPAVFKGCPDTDGDGVEDREDKCPEEAGLKMFDGCNDRDHDGVPDFADQCPDEPETINGVDDTDGCPDQGKKIVIVTKEKIEIREMVFFKTASAEIDERSFSLLGQVAQVLRANPEIEKVEVQGHTDSQGSEDYNQRLSQRRAESVVAYLISAGVDPIRLSAKGYGESQPVADNETPDGRAANRRVEFVIVEQD